MATPVAHTQVPKGSVSSWPPLLTVSLPSSTLFTLQQARSGREHGWVGRPSGESPKEAGGQQQGERGRVVHWPGQRAREGAGGLLAALPLEGRRMRARQGRPARCNAVPAVPAVLTSCPAAGRCRRERSGWRCTRKAAEGRQEGVNGGMGGGGWGVVGGNGYVGESVYGIPAVQQLRAVLAWLPHPVHAASCAPSGHLTWRSKAPSRWSIVSTTVMRTSLCRGQTGARRACINVSVRTVAGSLQGWRSSSAGGGGDTAGGSCSCSSCSCSGGAAVHSARADLRQQHLEVGQQAAHVLLNEVVQLRCQLHTSGAAADLRGRGGGRWGQHTPGWKHHIGAAAAGKSSAAPPAVVRATG